MALLGKKKVCGICEKRVGPFRTEIRDGFICKDCVKLLSPFFTAFSDATTAGLKDQLRWREESKSELAAFNRTRWFGEDRWKLYVDETSRKFMIMDGVTEYPDVFSLDSITDYDVKHYERIERSGDSDNESKSYHYNFRIFMTMDHPYVKKVWFEYRTNVITMYVKRITDEILEKSRNRKGGKMGKLINAVNGLTEKELAEYDAYIAEGEKLVEALKQI